MKPHRREPLEEEDDAEEAVEEDDEEREAGGVAVGSTDSDSGGGAGDGDDLQWARNGESERDFRCTDRLRKRPRSPASAAA
jgi:hypothetical protein